MKSNMKKEKIIIDIIMTILMILLMKVGNTGLKLHEIIGIIILILFITHKILNIKFIKVIIKNFFNNKIKKRTKVLFILDIILFIFISLNIVTGILISKYLFKNISILDPNIHKVFAWISLILISIHIGLHLNIKYLNKPIIKVIYLIFLVLGIISLSKLNITDNNYMHHRYRNHGIGKETTIYDTIYIMITFIGGTYYLDNLIKKNGE